MPITPIREPLDEQQLTTAVAAANLPTLLMVLFQLTGDRSWLEEPFRPSRTKGMTDNDTGGLPEEVQEVVREAAVQAILDWSRGAPVAIPNPTGDLLVELMSFCMGEDVPADYAPMMAGEMGFEEEPALPPVDQDVDFSVIVIGAGVSGLTASLAMKKAGIRHVVIEKNAEVGGTWLENRYPGCGVDTPSYLYSFSFFPRQWSGHFAKRMELENYVQDMAREFDLVSDIRFSTEVISAEYDEEAQRWRVVTVDAAGKREELVANAVITAVGQLNRPNIPDLPGMDSFRGRLFHSARWPADIEITGKKVVVVGTGASAMQIVPAIADQVDHLTVVQRSPQWAAPNANYFNPVADEVNWLMTHVPYYHPWYRFRLAWINNDRVHPSLQRDPEWSDERSINATNDGHRRFFTRYLEEQLAGRPDLIEKALPTYPPFGKRMLLDNGWFEAIKKPTVSLVTDRVTEVTETGVLTSTDTEIEADVIVFATGFLAQRLLHPLDIRGRDGISIREVWGDDDPRAYLGMTAPGFPNLFMMYGPNTNLGHGGSYIFLAECQVQYIVDLLRTMVQQRIGAVECRQDVCEEYNRRVDEAHERMIWTHRGMDTWYRNATGRVVTNSPWRVVDFWAMTRSADLQDFVTEPAAQLASSGR